MKHTNQNQNFNGRSAALLLVAVFVSVVTLLASGCKRESAKWEFARAMNLAEEGELVEAIELMEEALKRSPNDCSIKLRLARLLAENGQGELGIGHCDECLETRPHNGMARQVRSSCLQYLGRFEESLEEYKECLSGTVSRSPVEKNNLAYFRALANKELDKAARDIQSAIESIESESWGCRYLVPLQVRTAVSAGLISRHIDRQASALCPLTSKIEQYKQRMAKQSELIRNMIALEMQIEFPFGKQTENQLLFARGNHEVQRNCLGLLCTTRALVLEDLGQSCDADKDRAYVEELGFDFDELVMELPSDESCLQELENSFFLDTRGFISSLREWENEERGTEFYVSSGNIPDDDAISAAALRPAKATARKLVIPPSSYEDALEDLDFAVLAARYGQLALDSPLYNRPDISARQVKISKRHSKRLTAVLLYHRMQIHLRGGNQKAAAIDQRRIERLGLQPDSTLF